MPAAQHTLLHVDQQENIIGIVVVVFVVFLSIHCLFFVYIVFTWKGARTQQDTYTLRPLRLSHPHVYILIHSWNPGREATADE